MKELKTIRDILQAILDGHEVEFRRIDGCEWNTLKSLLIPVDRIDDKTERIYRIKLSKPSIDWEHVSKEIKYLAVDEDGQGFLFSDKPTKQEGGYWYLQDSLIVKAKGFISYKAGNCHWEDSLVERPEE